MPKIQSSGRRSFDKTRPSALDAELRALMHLVESRNYAEAELASKRILASRPGQALALKSLGFALLGQGRFEEALPVLRQSAALSPHDPELQNNLGIALNELMYWEESLQAFARAMQALPKDPEIALHMGMALSRMHRWNDAVPYLLKAIELYDGDYVQAIESLASCLADARRIDESWTCYRELHQGFPDNISYLSSLIYSSLKRCDWNDLAALLAALRDKSAGLTLLEANPFSVASMPGVTREELLKVAHHFALSHLPPGLLESQPALPWRPRSDGKIRIGYLSGDLLRHPVGFVIPEVIERHDRTRFEIFAYSSRKPAPDDPVRPRLERAFDHFREIADLSVRESLKRIREDEIDVLVDLAGWTAHGRPEALAFRCAPVQVNWLGYPGTMGHQALADYIIGDPVVTPIEHAAAFSEKIAQLPHCYLPADTARVVAEKPSRIAAGLPEDKFVFCSLNNSFKFNPEVWDVWCSILKEAPDSVLWLSLHSDAIAARLRAETEKRGVAAERLVFAAHVPSSEDHLARLALADLALDPFPFGSHSSGIDVLWAGVPMVSLLGNHFASRVGASELSAAGLSELIVTDLDAYQRLAVTLYEDRPRLDRLKGILVKRSELRLFDMGNFTRELENLLVRMLEAVGSGAQHLPAA